MTEQEPVPTDTGMEFHPNRQDFEQEMRRQRWNRVKQRARSLLYRFVYWDSGFEQRVSWLFLFSIWEISIMTILLFVVWAFNQTSRVLMPEPFVNLITAMLNLIGFLIVVFALYIVEYYRH